MSLLCATFSWSFAHFQNSAGEGYVIVMYTNMVPKAAWSIHPTLFAWQACTESNAADLKRRTANSFKPIDSGSHTRTVVRECCKGDNASQWEAQNLTPHDAQTPYSGIIKIGRGDYVVDPYTCAKVRHDSPRGFLSAHAWLCTPNCTPKRFFWGRGVATRYSQGSWMDFDAKYAETRGSAQGCAFSGSRT